MKLNVKAVNFETAERLEKYIEKKNESEDGTGANAPACEELGK